MRKLLLTVLFLMTVMGTTAYSQILVDAGLSLGASRHLGYKSPEIGIVGNGSLRSGSNEFRLKLAYVIKADKFVGEGSQLNAEAAVRHFFGNAFASGGIATIHQQVSGPDGFTKNFVSPVIGAGYSRELAKGLHGLETVSVLYNFPDFSSGNKNSQLRLEAETLVILGKGKYLALRPTFALSRNVDEFGRPYHGPRIGLSISFGIGGD